MKRFWIVFITELEAWRRDPLTAAGGFITTVFILLAFGLMFGGRLTFKIALLNDDDGPCGDILRETFDEVLSPFGTPYYDVFDLPEAKAWEAYRAHRIDGVWVVPAEFSQRMEAGQYRGDGAGKVSRCTLATILTTGPKITASTPQNFCGASTPRSPCPAHHWRWPKNTPGRK